jgi:hypothetical protein
MQARVKVLKVENKTGQKKDGSGPFDIDLLHVLDVDTVDKFQVFVDKEDAAFMRPFVGKEGVATLGVNAKTDKLNFVTFKAAA